MQIQQNRFFYWVIFLLATLLIAGSFVFYTISPTLFHMSPRPNTVALLTVTPSLSTPPIPTPSPTRSPTPSVTSVPLNPTATLAPISTTQRNELFTEIWTKVDNNYVYLDYGGHDWEAIHNEFASKVATASSEEAFYGLMRRMIERLGDNHSRFESPQEVAEELARFEGQLTYGGIGATVRSVSDGGLIVTLAQGGPAEEAGIKPRDIIVEVDGIPFTNTVAFGSHGPIGAVRGVPGTIVNLTIRSPGIAPRQVEIIRRTIPNEAFPNIMVQRLEGTQVGLIRIDTFYAEAIDQMVRADLERLLQAGPLKGIIIDVRANSGGFVHLMRETLALFINGGSIGSTKGRASSVEQLIPADRVIPELKDVPIVVLTSRETVSAAEMFVAGMKVHKRALIIGMPTAGNTENLSAHDLSDGSRLWLAELIYSLPDGSLIEGKGVTPDRAIDVEWWKYEPAYDPQILAAFEALNLDGIDTEMP